MPHGYPPVTMIRPSRIVPRNCHQLLLFFGYVLNRGNHQLRRKPREMSIPISDQIVPAATRSLEAFRTRLQAPDECRDDRPVPSNPQFANGLIVSPLIQTPRYACSLLF